jgi:hypothetical protein
MSDGPITIQSISKEIAKALLAYLTLNIDELRNLRDETLGAIVRLWIKFMDEGDPLTLLDANGLGSSRYSTEVEKRVKGKMNGISKSPLPSRYECLSLINKCIPDAFTSIRVILDLHIHNLSINEVEDIQALADIKLFTLVFTQDEPEIKDTILREYPKIRHVKLEWEPDHMKGLLKIRLNQIEEDAISSWCDPLAKLTMPDDRLIKASRGNPAHLIRMGSKLYERITEIRKEGKELSIKDLDELLLDHQS